MNVYSFYGTAAQSRHAPPTPTKFPQQLVPAQREVWPQRPFIFGVRAERHPHHQAGARARGGVRVHHYLLLHRPKLKPLPKLGTAADDFDSWALTAGILLNKVLFFSNKRTRL